MTECQPVDCAVHNVVKGSQFKRQDSSYVTLQATFRNSSAALERQERTCMLGFELYTQHVVKVNSVS